MDYQSIISNMIQYIYIYIYIERKLQLHICIYIFLIEIYDKKQNVTYPQTYKTQCQTFGSNN
jgi:hypothetical protein